MRTSAATKTITPNSPPIILKPHTPPGLESLASSPSGTEMQSVQDFVTSFLSEGAAAPQEPAIALSKVDTQDDVQHVAAPQELATNLTGVT